MKSLISLKLRATGTEGTSHVKDARMLVRTLSSTKHTIFIPLNLKPLKVVTIYVIVSALLGVLPTLGQPLGQPLGEEVSLRNATWGDLAGSSVALFTIIFLLYWDQWLTHMCHVNWMWFNKTILWCSVYLFRQVFDDLVRFIRAGYVETDDERMARMNKVCVMCG